MPDGASANLREIRRSVERATRLPTELVAEIAETRSLAQNAWTESRKDSDFDRFRPWLEKLVGLMQRKAECLGSESGEAWDALAEGFEPGMRAADLQVLFAPLRERLSALVQELAEIPRQRAPDDEINRLKLPLSEQQAFVRHVAGQMGFDFSRGRLDVSTHPFPSGSHCGDVRITTRFAEDDILDALGSTMHEVGHGLYEQGLAAQHVGIPLGEAVSLGIHESQSRLWENHVGRSADGDLNGTFDSPDQGAIGSPLSSVTFEDGTLTMVVSGIPGPPSFAGTLSGDGTVLSGAFVQLQFEIPLELTKRE